MALSKKAKKINELVDSAKAYAPAQAIETLQSLPKAKFNESVDLAVNLGVDPRKSDQVVRGSVVLPKGTGKKVRVAVVTSAAHADAAKAAGADLVGMDDLAADIKSGKIDFDLLLATPDAMRIVGQLGQVLGPRGLMPNPKDGTVTTDIAAAVKNAKMGQVRYRTDKNGIIHCTVGKLDFSAADLIENMTTVLSALQKAKPASAKGSYMKKVSLSTTMGPGLTLDISSVSL